MGWRRVERTRSAEQSAERRGRGKGNDRGTGRGKPAKRVGVWAVAMAEGRGA